MTSPRGPFLEEALHVSPSQDAPFSKGKAHARPLDGASSHHAPIAPLAGRHAPLRMHVAAQDNSA